MLQPESISANTVHAKLRQLTNKLLEPRLLLVFRIAYLCLAFLSWNYLFVGTKILSAVSIALVGLGALILLARLIQVNRFLNTPGAIFLLLFSCSFVLSALVNARYGVVDNVQGFAWLTLEFFVLYAFDSETDEKTYRSHFFIFCSVFIGLSFVMSFVSIVMAYVGFAYVGSIEYLGSDVGGMFDGRLYGLYSDPNLGAICSLVSCFISIAYICSQSSSFIMKRILVVNMLVQITYVGLSASRTALVACLVSSFILCVILLLKREQSEKSLLRYACICGKSCIAAVLSVALALGSVAVYETVSPSVFSAIGGPVTSESDLLLEALIQSETIETWDEGYDERISSASQPEAVEDSEYGVSGRDVEGDVSTGRMGIWSSAIDVWKTSPLVGVTHRNFSEYVHDLMPHSYFTRPWTAYTTMHNVFVDTLIAQGIIGLCLLLAFIGCVGRFLVRSVKNVSSNDAPLYAALIASLAAIGISALFYSEILYINTIGAVVFWSFLGMAAMISAPSSSVLYQEEGRDIYEEDR